MLNKIFIMGRLTKDPELRRTQNGTAVCSVSVAVERDGKGANGEKETDFIDVVAWKTTAEFLSKHFGKGKMVIIGGTLQMRDWTDRDGNKRRSAEVVARDVYFAEPKQKAEQKTEQKTETYAGAEGFEEVEDDDDLPF